MELRGSLSFSQEPVAGLYAEPSESSPNQSTLTHSHLSKPFVLNVVYIICINIEQDVKLFMLLYRIIFVL